MHRNALIIAVVAITAIAVIVLALQNRHPAAIGDSLDGSSGATNNVEASVQDEENPPIKIGPAVIALAGIQPEEPGQVRFEIANRGEHTLQFPDTWWVEFKDGDSKMLSMPQKGNLWVRAGQTNSLTINSPETERPWRLGASYLVENFEFNMKARISASSIGSNLPPTVIGERGVNAFSDWIDPLKK